MGKQKELQIDIQLTDDETTQQQTKQRVKKAESRVKAQQFEPSWNDVWVTGFTRPTGTFQRGIFQTKLTKRDKERLHEVMQATEQGEIPVGTPDGSLRRYTKTHALRMYKELQLIRRDSIIENLMADMPDNYYLINDKESFSTLTNDLWNEKEIAVDTETTGLNYYDTYEAWGDNVVGISFTLPIADYHVYIPFGHTSEGTQLSEEYVLKHLKPILESGDIKKVLFNAKFDIHMLLRHGIELGGFHFDGFVAMKLLNENEPSYSLKNLSTKYGRHFGFEDDSQTYEELFGRGGFEDAEFQRDGLPWIGTLYACKDTHLTYQFYKEFLSVHLDRLPELKKLYYDIENPVLEISVDMERNGLGIDVKYAEEYAEELRLEIAGYREELVKHFGNININSNQQLQRVLYDELGLPDLSKRRQVNARTLKRLSSYHDGVQVLLKYRDLNKLLTTYIEPFPQRVAKHDGRLHGTFNQVDTHTGRFASRNPNLQNLPQNARKIIVAPEDKVIVGIDYSQIEPRVLAHMSGDETLTEAYRQGKDLYTEMAMNVFNLERKYCISDAWSPCGTYEPRERIKIVYLGVMYGMGAYTLSQNLDSTIEEAEKHIENFFNTYSTVKQFVEDTHKEAEKDEFVETMYGRKRRFPNHRTKAKRYHAIADEIISRIGYIPRMVWEVEELPYRLKRSFWDVAGEYAVVNRQAVNTKIQGSSADLMKLALIAVWDVCEKHGFKILATIHDEILFEVPVNVTREQVRELEEAMLSIVELDVPLKVDTEIQKRWGEAVNVDKWFEGVEKYEN